MYFGISGLTVEYRIEPSLTIGSLVAEPTMWQEWKTKSVYVPQSKIARQNQRLENENIHMMMRRR